MNDSTITLTQAIFGMGNQNHDHVHRHNTMNINSMALDELMMEQHHGGIRGSTLNAVAAMSGGLSAQPQGFVTIEDSWNIRRGIGLLRFTVQSNALMEQELSVVGYLTGGSASIEGITPDTMFVPVRAWTTLSRNIAGTDGFPMTKTVVESSHQFLMGDPNMVKDLRSMRPIDVGNEALGFLAMENEGRGERYDGTVGTDLRTTLVVSKTQNLNPTHHTRELLRLAVGAGADAEFGGLEMGIADGLANQGMGEIGITENPFFATMMFSTGGYSMAGFQGFSVGEINSVFMNFSDVLNLTMLEANNFGADTNLATSEAYGSANPHELMATELAMLTVHLLLSSGLASFHFSATNNPMDFNGLVGSDEGVVVIPGEAMSVLNHDDHVINRVEQFCESLKTHFFAKYTSVYAHQKTIMNVEVDSHMFGETTVAICFNGEMAFIKQFTNATYMINRTSTNIAGSDIGLSTSKNYLRNIKEHFGQ
jgi:hypothetical protein